MKSQTDTITMSLQKYEEMKQELKDLKIQVREKTIIKEVIPPIYGYVIAFILFALMSYNIVLR